MPTGPERITPYGDSRHKADQVRDMFDSIAPAYDVMNRMMTLGIDRHWRAKAVKMIAAERPRRLLDVATGTGDLAIELAQKLNPEKVVGIDLSEGMVARGREKVERLGLGSKVNLSVGDCLDLPFADGEFDCVTVAFGVRNFERLLDGYREMARVLRPGGTLCVIELSSPTSPISRPFYRLYTRGVIPMVGKLISRDRRAYSYLPESIAACPQREQMTELMSKAGLVNHSFHPLTLGVCTIYIAHAPDK